ncbi:Protein IscX [Phycisphaerales bacterium]|nr:Protein IscX [Phycisphaerales bacterium]
MPDDTFHWLDVDVIGEELATAYPDRDPARVGFVELKKLVAALPGFVEKPGHVVNERILEEIQRCWIEERAGGRPEEE